MRWRVTWDGTQLVVVQRASRTVWFGVPATTALAAAWYPLVRDVGGALLILAVAVALVGFEIGARRRVEASDRIVRAGRWSVPAAQVRILTIRRETRWVSTRWGRGYLSDCKLFVSLVGGRTVDLITIDGAALDGRAGRELAAGLAALPYGRPPR